MLPVEKRIQSKADLQAFLGSDLRYYKSLNKLTYFLQYGEGAILMRHQVLLRKAEYYVNTKRRLRAALYKFLLINFQNKYSIHVPINCCGKGMRLMHVGPILMNSRVQTGDNCVFHINTALVAGGTNDDAPVLGNSVIMGVGSVALGGITIADNVAIGAGAVVNKTVMEENIAVGGVPARKISNRGRSAWNKGK